MSNDVVIKTTAPQWIASVRQVITNYPGVGALYGEIFGALGPAAFPSTPVAIWHDHEYKDKDVDAEAGLYLKHSVPANGRVKVYELPETTVASIIHNGAYNRLNESYDAIARWIGASGYKIAGPAREIYLKCNQPVRQDDESYVTEIQFPVEKG